MRPTITPDTVTPMAPNPNALTANIVKTMNGINSQSMARLSMVCIQRAPFFSCLARSVNSPPANAQARDAYDSAGSNTHKWPDFKPTSIISGIKYNHTAAIDGIATTSTNHCFLTFASFQRTQNGNKDVNTEIVPIPKSGRFDSSASMSAETAAVTTTSPKVGNSTSHPSNLPLLPLRKYNRQISMQAPMSRTFAVTSSIAGEPHRRTVRPVSATRENQKLPNFLTGRPAAPAFFSTSPVPADRISRNLHCNFFSMIPPTTAPSLRCGRRRRRGRAIRRGRGWRRR